MQSPLPRRAGRRRDLGLRRRRPRLASTPTPPAAPPGAPEQARREPPPPPACALPAGSAAAAAARGAPGWAGPPPRAVGSAPDRLSGERATRVSAAGGPLLRRPARVSLPLFPRPPRSLRSPRPAQSTGGRQGSRWARNFAKRPEEAARGAWARTQPSHSHTHTRASPPGGAPRAGCCLCVYASVARGPCLRPRTGGHAARSPSLTPDRPHTTRWRIL